MPLVTIFTAPKPFTNPHIALIQRNAIRSWVELGDSVEVFLVGEEDGMEQAAADYGVRHLTGVKRNHKGTPHLDSIFSLAREASDSTQMAIVNADIILTPDILEAAQQVADQAKNFLLCGKRWDLNITEELEFNASWLPDLRQTVRDTGVRNHIGMDYFLFPRHIYQEIPNFVIGRPSWDNWMIYQAYKQGWLAVDATDSVMVVHQKHDYHHLEGGKPPYGFEEGNRNIALAGGFSHAFLLIDVPRELKDGRIQKKAFDLRRLLHRIELWVTPDIRTGFRWSLARQLKRFRRRLGEKG
ncbi:MAG: hypothetical protein FVQ83_15255 [Chloroflexi bacterium]|nr:hypothetical protein [Chloroflexota bacterium]